MRPIYILAVILIIGLAIVTSGLGRALVGLFMLLFYGEGWH